MGSPSPHVSAQRESGFDLRGEEMLNSKMKSFGTMEVRLVLRSLRPPLLTVNLRRPHETSQEETTMLTLQTNTLRFPAAR